MDLPPLSQEQLSKVVESALSPSELFDTLSQYEIEACLISTDAPQGRDAELLSFFYSSFFISHLLTDQIYEARALTKRMPQILLQHDPSLQNCLNLLRAVWQHKHDHVYNILRHLPWSELLRPLVQRYEIYFQDKTLSEVSRAYEAIRPATAAQYLGLDPESAEQGDPAIIEKFTTCGWSWDKEAKLLYPKPIIPAPEADGHLSNGMSEILRLIGNHAS